MIRRDIYPHLPDDSRKFKLPPPRDMAANLT